MIRDNKILTTEINRIAETASYLWEKGWAERNGGNISVNVTDCLTPKELKMKPVQADIPLAVCVEELRGHVFYVTGTGKRMRYVAREPWANGALIRINATGNGYDIIAENPIRPTSELSSHLLMHNYLLNEGRPVRVVLHTHPTEIIGLTHCKPLLDAVRLTRLLWSMIPECRIIVPRGLGIVGYEIPGSIELARATIEQLRSHDIILWEKHGILAVGEDIIDCFDAIDTLSKSAQIYFSARAAGFEPEGMTDEQMEGLIEPFGLPSN